eukprot:Colp12_sorted_trinity150504_noHs@1791
MHKQANCRTSCAKGSKSRRHLLVHSGYSPFHCKTCGRAYNRSERALHCCCAPVRCDLCQRIYKQVESLKKHYKKKHGLQSHELNNRSITRIVGDLDSPLHDPSLDFAARGYAMDGSMPLLKHSEVLAAPRAFAKLVLQGGLGGMQSPLPPSNRNAFGHEPRQGRNPFEGSMDSMAAFNGSEQHTNGSGSMTGSERSYGSNVSRGMPPMKQESIPTRPKTRPMELRRLDMEDVDDGGFEPSIPSPQIRNGHSQFNGGGRPFYNKFEGQGGNFSYAKLPASFEHRGHIHEGNGHGHVFDRRSAAGMHHRTERQGNLTPWGPVVNADERRPERLFETLGDVRRVSRETRTDVVSHPFGQAGRVRRDPSAFFGHSNSRMGEESERFHPYAHSSRFSNGMLREL